MPTKHYGSMCLGPIMGPHSKLMGPNTGRPRFGSVPTGSGLDPVQSVPVRAVRAVPVPHRFRFMDSPG